MLLDIESGETTLVESDPEGEVDFGFPIFMDSTEELVGTGYIGDRVRIYPRNVEFAKMYEELRSKLPDGELGFNGGTEDDRLFIVSVSRDVNPGEVYLYNRKSGKVEKLYDSRPDLPSEYLAEMKPVRYPTRDGATIPAYLTVPKGVEAKNLPTVIFPHGGPWARDTWGYDGIAQFLANRGYAVLQPNFRGSTGYGKAFLNAGNMEWGTGLMQHDITDGVKYLIDQGIADPKRVAIMGGSYGGYATLAGVTFTPDLYAAGVSIVGPSNIITLLNSIPAYWGPIKKIFALRVGDPDIPEQAEMLREQSPFFHAKNIKAPLLVIQGANDPRVKKAESDQIVVALRDLKRDVQYVVAPDEGHGFAGRENRLAMFAAIEKFLAGHIGGRYQESVEGEVAEKLETMTLDVSTVEIPKLATGADAAKTSPLPQVMTSSLAPMNLEYSTTLSMGGREMKLDSKRMIRKDTVDGQDVWRVESSVESPMGAGSDKWILSGKSLRPIRRDASQGMAKINVEYGEKVTGMIKAGAQEIPIDGETTAPVFGDEAGSDMVVTALPLAADYRTTFRTFEVGMQQRQRVWSLHVDGSESVTVPAGEFDTWKVVVEPLDGEGGGTTYWVSKDPRMIVKAESTLPPQMGGGTTSSELVSHAKAE